MTSFKQGDRVSHIDGGTGTIQAYYVVWDKGQSGERSGYYCESVLRPIEEPSDA